MITVANIRFAILQKCRRKPQNPQLYKNVLLVIPPFDTRAHLIKKTKTKNRQKKTNKNRTLYINSSTLAVPDVCDFFNV